MGHTADWTHMETQLRHCGNGEHRRELWALDAPWPLWVVWVGIVVFIAQDRIRARIAED